MYFSIGEVDIVIDKLLANLAYISMIAVIVTRFNPFKKNFIKGEYKTIDYIILSIFFGCLGMLGTYLGINIEGAIANTRIVSVMAGGILFGPLVGVLSGILAAIHRVYVNPLGITTIPCVISTITAGVLGGQIFKKNYMHKSIIGFIAAVAIETLEMILIYFMAADKVVGIKIIEAIYLPMAIANGTGVMLVIIIIKDIFTERDKIMAQQSKQSLDIAKKTLDYFRKNKLTKACEVIMDSLSADAVVITDTKTVLAYIGKEITNIKVGDKIKTKATLKALTDKKTVILKNREEIVCLKSAIIIPLFIEDDAVGTLKIFYKKENRITNNIEELAQGLGQIISNQLELSKVDKLRETALKAELKALQSQINPHFLFNALNTISYLIRTNPQKARELVANLGSYMRYNLENGVKFVCIYKEVEQVKAYFQIEKERFLDKIDIEYKIEEDLNIKIPSLVIQPLIENSIKHGFKNIDYQGKILLDIHKLDDNRVKIVVEDNGEGIDESIIKAIEISKKLDNKIGLFNVNYRVKLLYNKGLVIKNLNKGTRISFVIERGVENELYNS